MQIDHRKH